MNYIVSVLLLISVMVSNIENSVSIKINEIESTKGNIQVSVFVNQKDFENKKPYMKKVFPKKDYLKNGVFQCDFNLPNGTYGIVILDDENADGQMDYNFFKMPKEGYGFSNFIHESLSKPKFSDFQFTLNKNQEFNIVLRYF